MKFNTAGLIVCLCLISVLSMPIIVRAQLKFEDPLAGSGSAETRVINIIFNIINFILTLSAAFALLSFLIAGTRYLLGAVGGEPEIQKAKQILLWSIVGLLIIGTSLLILTAVAYFLGLSGASSPA